MNDLVFRKNRPPTNKTKLNRTNLHTDTYMRTYTEKPNETKQNKNTQDRGSNSEELNRTMSSGSYIFYF